MVELHALAEELQPHLKGSAGPAPGISHIMAAILIARDSYGSRAACRAVPGVPESVHSRVKQLAVRVHALFNIEPPSFLSLPPLPRKPSPQPQPSTYFGSIPNLPIAYAIPIPSGTTSTPPLPFAEAHLLPKSCELPFLDEPEDRISTAEIHIGREGWRSL